MELKKAIKERMSIRAFSNKKPDWKEILECIDLARYAPMAGNQYSPRFILIDDKEKIKGISSASEQDFFQDVDYLVVVLTDPAMTKNSYGERSERYLRQQAGAAIQNFLLGIQEKGLSTCWVGHFIDEEVKKIIGVNGKCEIEAVFPIGYEDKKKKLIRRKKIELENILFFNKYRNKYMRESIKETI